jgi:acyl dehydratase
VLDRRHLGRELPPFRVTVEAGRLRFFAKVIGETNPIYLDEAAARAGGYPALPVPPTFLFAAEQEQPDPWSWLGEVGLDLKRVLHGEQRFTYHRVPTAGETLTFRGRIADMYEKKGGALEFLVKEVAVTDAAGAPVAELTTVMIQRNG